MHDRAQFWSPLPDWVQVSLHARGIDIAVVDPGSIWLVSGDIDAFAARRGAGETLGPRKPCSIGVYALRVAPDRILLVGGSNDIDASAANAPGCVATDVSDGFLIFEIRGEAAAEVMAQGSEYPLSHNTMLPHESAMMQFAGLRVAVARRPDGWRLHIERPWAPALWQWLEAHIDRAKV